MTTVFTLSGAFNLQPNQVYKQLPEVCAGNIVVPILYNSFTGPGEAKFMQGVEMLDTAIYSTPGKKVVFGHSLGAVLASRWLHDHEPDGTIDPADLSFVFIGNSIRKYGGSLYAINQNNYPRWDTPYTVIDVARQYDGWADAPTDATNKAATANAQEGSSTIHPFYQNVSMSAPNVTSYTEGNITYKLIPTYPLPVIKGPVARNWWWPWPLKTVAEQDAEQRPIVEAAYHRPMEVAA